MNLSANELTQVLAGRRNDEWESLLYQLVEPRLRKIANRMMWNERADHTLQPTVLLDDAFLKLANQKAELTNSRMFFSRAARLMQQSLVDYARAKCATKRGGGEKATSLADVAEPIDRSQVGPADFLAINELYEKLADKYPDSFEIFQYRYFGGWQLKEIADDILKIPYDTVVKRWKMAQSFLGRELSGHSK